MIMDDKKIKKILLEEGYVGESDMAKAEEYAKAEGASITNYLFSENIITKDLFGQALAEYYHIPFLDLERAKIDQNVMEQIPEVVARAKGVIAFERDKDGVKVGMVEPDDLETRNLVEKRLGDRILPYYVVPQDLEIVFNRYKADLKTEFNNILKRLADKGLARDEQDGIVVEITDLLIKGGFQAKASDIHIEPYAKKVVVRFRVDGVLHDILEVPKDLASLILARIKVLAKMRIDEHQKAQDGKFRFDVGIEVIDIRVSIVPVTQGENVVMRLLSSANRHYGLADLGLAEENLRIFKSSIKNPHGMILVTGPTGSGKTTTLYAIMSVLNKRDVHIATIEDPVEYDIESVTQIQVNPKAGLTFAKGLRSIVRQDPDIIMVGEIRDEETADIAVNSAMTGHLVLSTLHTNDAATALPRFLDMGVEPFLIASTINVVIAQRLVRKICPSCRTSHHMSEDEEKAVNSVPNVKNYFHKKGYKNISKLNLYKGEGCKICAQTGYVGRMGIFEVLEMKDNIKDMVIKRSSSDEIMNIAIKENGMTTMLDDGIEKVLAGQTTLEEVLRVIM